MVERFESKERVMVFPFILQNFEMDPKGVRDEIQARCWREEFER
jgi:hypothetical protein